MSLPRSFVLLTLLTGTSFSPTFAQQVTPTPTPPALEEPEEIDVPPEGATAGEAGTEIVVTGQRIRGQVAGDIPPEVQLDERDIQTYGAGSLAELLDALAPLTQSGRGRGGGRPVVLLNGRRISGFSEIRNLPPEAIERVDILPEEVALRYGYRADQRVVNFVLRESFSAVTAELEGGVATAGGRARLDADANILRVTPGGRWNLDAEYEHRAPLLESERDIALVNPLRDERDFRTLLAESDEYSIAGTINRTILTDISATLNARFDGTSSRALIGLPATGGTDPLTRDTDTTNGHLGVAMNGDLKPWRWSFTGNFDRGNADSVIESDALPTRTHTVTQTATAELVANGPLFDLPAGDVTTSLRVGAGHQSLRGESERGGILQERELSRGRGNFQANLDVPIASRRRDVLSAIGDLSANFNIELEELSDFGTLRTIGGGFNWSPIEEVRLIASFTDEDGAPSMQQLGDPTVLVPNVRVFDFLRGETVDIDRIEGGNPALVADNRRVYKLGLTVRPFEETDLSFRADYNQSRIDNPIAAFPTATPEIEAAFPDRFVRGADGRLVQIDSRPTNFARSKRKELRWGLNYSKSLGEEEPRRGGRGRGARQAGEEPPVGPGQVERGAARPERGAGQEGRGGGGRGGFGRGGRGGFGGGGRFGGGGGGRGGRLQLGLFHTWVFEDEILIRPGVPELDLLGGSAVGSRGGQPRHQIEFQAGVTKNGLGARLNSQWQSGTTVLGGPDVGGGTTGDLRFGSFMTTNLRLFANLDQQEALIRRAPWLKRTRITLSIDNLFDNRLRVRDETGATPIGYQPDRLDPLGRTVLLGIRKQF